MTDAEPGGERTARRSPRRSPRSVAAVRLPRPGHAAAWCCIPTTSGCPASRSGQHRSTHPRGIPLAKTP